MKPLISAMILMAIVACSESKKESNTPTYKIVCGDSIEQEQFDENGDVLFVKIPGTCDTILFREED
jgi:hypothetical protein